MTKIENWRESMFNDGLHLSVRGNKFIFSNIISMINESIPEISLNSLPTHRDLHSEVTNSGSKTRDVKEGNYVILNNGFVWDWEVSNFVKKQLKINILSGKLVSSKSSGNVVRYVDCDGKYILPGLVDAHLHVELLGKALRSLNLTSCRSLNDVKDAITTYLNTIPGNEKRTIIGFGWDHEKYLTDGKRLLSKEIIDSVCNDRPVFIYRVCAHIACLNTKALEVARVHEMQENGISGGAFDTESNDLTGIIRENACKEVLKRLEVYDKKFVSDPTKDRESNILEGLHHCKNLGITTVDTNDPYSFDIYNKLDTENRLPIRVNLVTSNEEFADRKPYKSTSNMFTNRRVKFFADGSLGSDTAALKVTKGGKQCLDIDGNDSRCSGILLYSDEELEQRLVNAKTAGFQFETHCIGDAALEQVLRLYVKVYNADAHTFFKLRPQITHCQIATPKSVEILGKYGIVVNTQPSFVPSDIKFLQTRLGKSEFPYDRLSLCYCWKTLLKAGVCLTGSSDAPIENANPLEGMFDLIARPEEHIFDKTHESPSFNESECLKFFQALSLYTNSAHYGSYDEHDRGRLEPGFFADMTILSGCVYDLDKSREFLKSSKVDSIWVNGVETVLNKNQNKKLKVDMHCC